MSTSTSLTPHEITIVQRDEDRGDRGPGYGVLDDAMKPDAVV
jgi:hypothetical protein